METPQISLPPSVPVAWQRLIADRPRVIWLLYAVFALLLWGGVLWVGGTAGRDDAYEMLGTRARNAAVLNAALLRTTLEKQRSLPFVLAQDRDVRETLQDPSLANLRALNHKFENLAEGTNASVIYLLDHTGMTLAASNWRTPISFVGNDYAFRPYFLDALSKGGAEYYALGTASHLPGLYITRRIDGPNGVLGVIVVKVQFDQVEEDWRKAAETSYVSDTRDVVVVTSVPEWRFLTLVPIPETAKAALRKSLQFGDAPLTMLPITPFSPGPAPDIVTASVPDMKKNTSFMRVSVPVPDTQWTLHLLAPLEKEVASGIREGRLVATLRIAPVLLLLGLIVHRHNRNLHRAAENLAVRQELERRVRDRTEELSTANNLLQSEIRQRQAAVLRLQEAREELAQANRLAILGQVSAGIAHDINQPVAAIRSYADNAQVFLKRGNVEAVRENLGTIASLTQRITTVIEDLRAFARRRTGGLEPVLVTEVIDGAFLLMNNRLRQQGIDIVYDMPPPELAVLGNRVRLEQVLVNLMQNAMEAMETTGQQDRRLVLGWSEQDNQVSLTISDNGPGIPDTVMQRLFTPFTTTKQGGLGLGLIICNDIITEFGGRLEVETSAENGTRLTVHLKRATSSGTAEQEAAHV